MSNNKTVKIIFNVANRSSYLHRYFKLLKGYKINFDILVINDFPNEFFTPCLEKINTNIITKYSEEKITGINSIFKIIYKFRDLLLKYKYVCFVEDDNFIFPNTIDSCIKYLNVNQEYIACNGLSFLFKKNKKYLFLNKYHSPSFKSLSIIERVKQYNNNGGLIYYSVIKTEIFINICKEITYIKDDNLSEIFFNYLILIKGNLKSLNQMYLAREYPRPPIYNVPPLHEWIKNNKLAYDINMIILRLIKNIKKEDKEVDFNLFLRLTIFNYLSKKINPQDVNNHNKNLFKKIYNVYYQRKFEIKHFLNSINFT